MNSKSKKFYSKIVMICAMFSLLFGAFYGAISGIATAATITNTEKTSNEIKISNIPSKGEVGSPLTINKATGATGVVITLTDPYANKAELVDSSVNPPADFAGTITNQTSSYTFTPSEAGTYTLSYVYSPDPEAGVKVQGETYKIVVTSGTANLNWAKNASYTHATEGEIYPLIPHKAVSGADTWYYLPVPTVVDENGDEISGAEAILNVTDASGSLLINTAASDATVSEELAREITVKDADNNDVTLYAFKAGTSKGIYTISYFYRGTDGAKADKTYTVEVLDASAFNPSDYNLTFSFDGTMPETAVLGKEVTLPSVTAHMQLKNDKTGDSKIAVNAFTKIKVQKVNANGTKTDVALDGYTFTPTEEGAYYVTYQVVNAYGKSSAVNGYTISDVEDTEAPVVQVVENYEVTEEGEGNSKKLLVSEATVNGLVDASYLVPTKFGAGAKHTFKTYTVTGTSEAIGNGKTYLAVELPAIFASDNVVEYNDIELSREVYNNSNVANVFYLDDMAKNPYDKTVFNGKSVIALGVNTGDTYNGANNTITALFSEAGEYTIRYKATADGLAATPITFKLTIVESMEDTDAPVITVSSEIPAATYDDAVLTFAKPVAVDTVDANVKAYTYYYFGNPTIEVGDGADKVALPAISAGTISLKDYLNGEYVTNAGLEMLASKGILKAFETNKAGKLTLDIETANTNSDSTLTVVTYAMDYYYRMNTDSAKKDVAIVNKEIKLINLTDDNTSPSVVSVSRDKEAYNYTSEEKNGYYTVINNSNWENDANFAGEFTNVHQNYEVYLPQVSFTDDSGNENVAINIRVYDPQGGSQRVTTTVENGMAKGGKFTPKYAGDYYVVYTATDESNNVSMICFKMRSIDTAAPEIRGAESFPATAELGTTINLPSISVFDNGKEITNNVGTEAKLVLLPSEDYNTSDFKTSVNEFTPNSIATYSFKYTAKDAAGNEAIATFSVVVTDSSAPVINLTTTKTLTWGYDSGEEVNLGAITDITENGVEMYAPIIDKIPYFNATDADDVTVSMSLKYNGNSAEQIDEITSSTKTNKFVYSVKNGALNFVPAYGKGKYILTYTAVDASSNKTEFTYTLAVGDTSRPIITLSSTNNVSSAKLNSTLTLDLSANGVTVSDDQGAEQLKNFGTDANPRYFELKITAPDKTTIEVNYSGTTVTFSQVGTYTFTYTAEDEAGNKQTKTVYVVVSGDEANTEGDSIVWMVIIIILSLLVLAFVIWFFLRDPKNKKGTEVESKKSESKKEVKKDNDDNDKVVV